jgi:hypothetical protein
LKGRVFAHGTHECDSRRLGNNAPCHDSGVNSQHRARPQLQHSMGG